MKVRRPRSVLGPSHWDLTTTLEEVRDYLEDALLRGEIVSCPACTQKVCKYHRRINSGAALALTAFYREYGTEWGHGPSLPEVSRVGGEWARLRYWGLIEEELERRPDGGRAGWWRVTALGRRYIHGRATVPEHILLFGGAFLGFAGDYRGIDAALGDSFDLRELLAPHLVDC